MKSAKMLFTKEVRLNWYSSMNSFFRKIRIIFDIENSRWKFKIGTFWQSVTGNFIWLQLILGQKPCLCKVPNLKIPIPKLIYWVWNYTAVFTHLRTGRKIAKNVQVMSIWRYHTILKETASIFLTIRTCPK